MTVGDLRKELFGVPDELEIVVRCEWDNDEPNGNCFNLVNVIPDYGCTETLFAIFDCNQEMKELEAAIAAKAKEQHNQQ